jgi:hypothetical protein
LTQLGITRAAIMLIEVSIGELIDKITILSIKQRKIKNRDKLGNIQKEYDLLKSSLDQAGIAVDSKYYEDLETVNLKLWDIEDKIREKEANKEFDEEFIQLARSVYINNDHRAAIKRNLNLNYGSDLVEEKEYVIYST